MHQTSSRLLRVSEVAQRLGIRESTIRRRILERRIDYVKVGRSVRIPLEEVNLLIAQGYRASVSTTPHRS